MRLKNYEVEILVNDRIVKEYNHEGKIYIEGKEGSEFSINIKNNGSCRILAIPTVDGISVIDGKKASFDSRGYIISGYNSVKINGWRVSDDGVNKFYFTEVDKSYSTGTKQSGNEGIIGVAIFREEEQWGQKILDRMKDLEKEIDRKKDKDPRYPWSSLTRSASTGPSYFNAPSSTTVNLKTSELSNSCCYQMKCSSQELGTGFGEYKNDAVVTTTFEKEKNPDSIFEIYYDSRKNLIERGVNLDNKVVYVSAFPKENGYCKPPKS